MSFDPFIYEAGDGLIALPNQFVDGTPIADESEVVCEVSRSDPPFDYIHSVYYFLHAAGAGETLDITTAVAALQAASVATYGGAALDFIAVSFGASLEGHAGIAACGNRDHAFGTSDFDGPFEAVSNPTWGWDTTFEVNNLTLSLDGTPTEMAASYNTSGWVFTSLYEQEVAPDYRTIFFTGWALRATVETWVGQDPANDANRIMFAPDEISTVAWGLTDTACGELHSEINPDTHEPSPFRVAVHGYHRLYPDSPATAPMCVL